MEISCLWALLFTCLNSHVFLVLGDPYTSYLAGGKGVVYGVGSRGLGPREPQSTTSPLQGSPASLNSSTFPVFLSPSYSDFSLLSPRPSGFSADLLLLFG